MIRLIRYLLLALHFVVGSTLGLLIGILRPFHPTNSRWCAQIFGFAGLPIIGTKVKSEGHEHYPTDRPYIVVANHQSNWDLFVVGSVVPQRTVSLGKKSLKWIPFFGQLYWLAGNVLIDRGNAKKAMEAMEITKNALQNKHTNIWIFPEGTRNHGQNMLPFKKGAFVTAIHAQVPIVQVCTSSYLDGFSLDNLKNPTAHIRILEPIETKGMTIDDLDSLMETCRSRMMTVIEELDAIEQKPELSAQA
jgi:1-acyl-sn-glycerol-3-phosphate acyltransferase